MKLRVTVEGKTYEVEVEVVEDAPAGPMYGSTSVHSTTVVPHSAPSKANPSHAAEQGPLAAAAGGVHVVKAPIVGTILQLKVAPGDTVSVNQVLLIMEAMKMETNIASPIAGTVKTIRVSPGEAVKAGQVLVEFE